MKKLNREQTTDYLLKALLLLVLVLSAVFIITFLFPAFKSILKFAVIALLPFLIAWLISVLTEPLAVFMNKKLRIHKALAAIIIILLFLTLIALVCVLIFNRIMTEISNFDLDSLAASLQKIVEDIQAWLADVNENSNLAFIQNAINSALENIGEHLRPLMEGAFNFVLATPGTVITALIFTMVTIMAIFFMVKDSGTLQTSIFNIFPAAKRARVSAIYKNFTKILSGYFWAQIFLVSTSMTMSCIFFIILGIPGPLTLALFIGVLDLMPVVGPTGLILPLAAYHLFISGNYFIGVGLVILLLVLTVMRNILEPKVVGDKIGIKPLYTLVAIFVGLKLFGLLGIALGPLSLAFGVCLYRSAKMTNEELMMMEKNQ
ncbi:MAG: sporulation integral membrane protein YtvI [Clostridiales bacterium]|nr:sporulation integral membrane protein YtvI [Clostridiales bacterium]